MLNHLADKNSFGVKIRPDRDATCNGFGPHQSSHACLHQPVGSNTPTATPPPPPPNYHTLEQKEGNVGNMNSFEQQFMKILQKVNETIEANERRLAEQDERENIKLEWQHVARIIDRILLTLFVIVTLTTTCAVMFQTAE